MEWEELQYTKSIILSEKNINLLNEMTNIEKTRLFVRNL